MYVRDNEHDVCYVELTSTNHYEVTSILRAKFASNLIMKFILLRRRPVESCSPARFVTMLRRRAVLEAGMHRISIS
jgi:hypothetical protein